MKTLRWLTVMAVIAGCGGARSPEVQMPPAVASACDEYQTLISRYADARAASEGQPGIAQHLAKNFPDGRVSWLMKEEDYQTYVVKPQAREWGRPFHYHYLFASPAAVILTKVEESKIDGQHNAAMLGNALGLQEKHFTGPLLRMTIDIRKTGLCVRLPVRADPGAAPECKTAEAKECFKSGGYTSGGVAEIMVINAPVDQTEIKNVDQTEIKKEP